MVATPETPPNVSVRFSSGCGGVSCIVLYYRKDPKEKEKKKKKTCKLGTDAEKEPQILPDRTYHKMSHKASKLLHVEGISKLLQRTSTETTIITRNLEDALSTQNFETTT